MCSDAGARHARPVHNPLETPMTQRPSRTPRTAQPDRRRLLQQGAALGAGRRARPAARRPGVRAGARRPRPLPAGQDRLEAGRGRVDHRRGDPGQLLREPDRAAAAVRGAHRHQGALREGAAGADPAEGDARPVVEDRHLRDPRGRPDVLPAVRRQQVGRAARQVPERRQRSPTRPGSSTTTSSRPGARPTRSTASPTASPTTAR